MMSFDINSINILIINGISFRCIIVGTIKYKTFFNADLSENSGSLQIIKFLSY